MKEIPLNPLQQKLYELLIEIDDICRKNRIIYYLAAGGALGAIRNNGFLPWDDDLDIYITRNNWEKLKKAIALEVKSNRDFICEEETRLYNNTVGRYLNKDTTLMMKSQLVCGKCAGVMIDILIMDPMPIKEKEKWKHREFMKVYTELLSPYLIFNDCKTNENRDFNLYLYKKYYRKSKILGRARVLNELKRKFTSFPDEICTEYCMRWGRRTIIYKKKLFGAPRYVKFENREFPIMRHAEKSFRIGYGDDWMYVPEREKQIKHAYIEDLKTPFEEYVNIYMPIIKRKRVMRAYKKDKKQSMKAVEKKTIYERNYLELKVKLAADNIKEKYKISHLREFLQTKKLNELENELEYYFFIQFNDEVLKYNILVPIGDEYLYVISKFLVKRGLYFKASKLIQLREQRGPLKEELMEIKETIDVCRSFSIAIYDEFDENRVMHLLEKYLYYKNKLIDYSLAELWMLKRNAKETADFRYIIRKVYEFYELYETKGELIAYEAYALYQLGEKDKAKEKYKIAVKETRNGFVWKEAMLLSNINPYKS